MKYSYKYLDYLTDVVKDTVLDVHDDVDYNGLEE
jgi:hypothetical protein